MGRREVDLDDDILEINAHAQAIAEAAKRKEQHTATPKTPSMRDTGTEKVDEKVATIGPAQVKTPHNLEVVDGSRESDSLMDDKTRRNRARARNSKVAPAPNNKSLSDDDPWVTGSIKVRISKKLRFHRLSRTRELGGLVPFQKQDLLDEALDYIFEKYSVE